MPLTDQQMKYLALAWECFETEPKVDYTKFHQIANLASANSARELLRVTKKKLREEYGALAADVANGKPGGSKVAGTPKKVGTPGTAGTPKSAKVGGKKGAVGKGSGTLSGTPSKRGREMVDEGEDDQEEVVPTPKRTKVKEEVVEDEGEDDEDEDEEEGGLANGFF